MAALAWLAIPAVATLAAIGWVAWTRRPRRPADAHDTVARHERFRQAIDRPPPAGRSESDTR